MTEKVRRLELDTQRLALVTKALADPSRIEILRLLARSDGDCCNPGDARSADGVCVCDLVEQTGFIQSLVSYHMKILREAGLVHEMPQGKWKHYRINSETVQALLDAWSSLLLNP